MVKKSSISLFIFTFIFGHRGLFVFAFIVVVQFIYIEFASIKKKLQDIPNLFFLTSIFRVSSTSFFPFVWATFFITLSAFPSLPDTINQRTDSDVHLCEVRQTLKWERSIQNKIGLQKDLDSIQLWWDSWEHDASPIWKGLRLFSSLNI